MRTRTITQVISTPNSFSDELEHDVSGVNPDVNRHYTWTGHTDGTGVNRTIEDELPKMKHYGSCLHTTNELLPFECAGSHERAKGIPGRLYTYSYAPYALFNRAISAAGGGSGLSYVPNNPLGDWESLSSSAVRAMLPSFSERNSLVNFVLELKDIRRIPDVWSKRRGVLKNIANAHLNYAFGIAPLVSDITSLVNTFTNFRKKVRDLQSGSGKTITRHFSSTLPVSTLPMESVVYSEGGADYEVRSRHSWVKTPRYHASMRYSYKLPDMTQIGNQVLALLDALGVRRDGAIIWNAIRFSFVADWFVRCGKFLNGLSVDNLQIPVVIEDFCHSANYSILNELLDSDFGARHLVCQRAISYYIRRRTIPRLNVPSLDKGEVTISKVALGASLFLTTR